MLFPNPSAVLPNPNHLQRYNLVRLATSILYYLMQWSEPPGPPTGTGLWFNWYRAAQKEYLFPFYLLCDSEQSLSLDAPHVRPAFLKVLVRPATKYITAELKSPSSQNEKQTNVSGKFLCAE